MITTETALVDMVNCIFGDEIGLVCSRTNYRLVDLFLILVTITLFWYIMYILCLLKTAEPPLLHMAEIDTKDFFMFGNL